MINVFAKVGIEQVKEKLSVKQTCQECVSSGKESRRTCWHKDSTAWLDHCGKAQQGSHMGNLSAREAETRGSLEPRESVNEPHTNEGPSL